MCDTTSTSFSTDNRTAINTATHSDSDGVRTLQRVPIIVPLSSVLQSSTSDILPISRSTLQDSGSIPLSSENSTSQPTPSESISSSSISFFPSQTTVLSNFIILPLRISHNSSDERHSIPSIIPTSTSLDHILLSSIFSSLHPTDTPSPIPTLSGASTFASLRTTSTTSTLTLPSDRHTPLTASATHTTSVVPASATPAVIRGSLSMSGIIGIVIGIVLFVLTIACVLLYGCMIRRKAGRYHDEESQNHLSTDAPLSAVTKCDPEARPNDESYSQVELGNNSLCHLEMFGQQSSHYLLSFPDLPPSSNISTPSSTPTTNSRGFRSDPSPPMSPPAHTAEFIQLARGRMARSFSFSGSSIATRSQPPLLQ
ncbi:hypothetical protein QCA50_007191 [Cerrena zonata]|uniref:Uncharacterized protein n=1 Tax=Cerrena zonata TaxID=2478898 RepID=A0AAW0GCL5_9APHY